MDIPLGNIKAKRSFMGFLFGKMILKGQMKDDRGLKKNLPTDKSFVITNSKEFEKVKSELLDSIYKYQQLSPKDIDNKLHPFFGKLSYDEWGILIYKHINHHLKQFGV